MYNTLLEDHTIFSRRRQKSNAKIRERTKHSKFHNLMAPDHPSYVNILNITVVWTYPNKTVENNHRPIFHWSKVCIHHRLLPSRRHSVNEWMDCSFQLRVLQILKWILFFHRNAVIFLSISIITNGTQHKFWFNYVIKMK